MTLPLDVDGFDTCTVAEIYEIGETYAEMITQYEGLIANWRGLEHRFESHAKWQERLDGWIEDLAHVRRMVEEVLPQKLVKAMLAASVAELGCGGRS